MGGTELRDMGITPAFAPIIKRATHRLSDGRSVVIVPDTNLVGGGGDDVTGTAKIFIYLSDDADRDSFSLAEIYTPASVAMTSTRAFVGSSCIKENGTLFLAYQAADNSLRVIEWAFTGTDYNFVQEQTIIAANAVTSRFRAVDIDAAPGNANLAVIVYESLASSGQGMWIRTYVRMNNGTTWTKAWEHNQFTSQFIKAGAEDVSISWNREGIVSNVGEFAIYYTWTSTTVDNGDYVRLVSFNTSTGTTNSGTLVNSWFTTLNKGIATGSRKGWLYQEANDRWMFATSVGTAVPQFISMRLWAGAFTGVVQNKTSIAIQTQVYQRKLVIVKPFGATMSCVSTEYADGRVLFAISGKGAGLNAAYMARVVVMRFDETDLTKTSALAIDTESRPLDGGYYLNNGEAVGVIGISGGGSKYNTASQFGYSFAVIYGGDGLPIKVRSVTEDTYSAPVQVSPNANPGVECPTLRASFQNNAIYSNLRGKIQWQFSTAADFSTDTRTYTQPDSEYWSYSSTNGIQLPSRSIVDVLPEAHRLFGDTWWVRCRVVDDLGGVSPWSSFRSFPLVHPPVANPLMPRPSVVIPWVTGDTKFLWDFTDTEPSDSISAYQVVVTRNDTGAVVTDTGKVLSTDNQVVLDLPDTLTGIPLQWQVSLWDQDDVQGPFSNPQIFTMMHAPRVVLTDPTVGATLTTAAPTIEWLFDANNDRTQRAYRVVIIDVTGDVDEFTVADTGWLMGDDPGYTFQTNVLQNGRNYLVYVEVQDSVGMYGQSVGILNGNWTFETNILGWTQTNATLAHSTAFAVNGSGSMKLTPGGGGNKAVATSDKFPVMHDISHRGSAWVYMPSSFAGNVSLVLNRYDAAGVFVSSASGLFVITPGQWTEIEAFASTTSAHFYMSIAIEVDNTSTAANIIYIDEAIVTPNPVFVDTDWVEPAQPATTVTYDTFKATISWTDAALDPDFVAYRVYRKYSLVADEDLDTENSGDVWVLIHETNENSPTVTYLDYLVPLNTPVTYAVVQLVDRFGSIIESDISFTTTVTVPGERYFFVPRYGIGSIASYEASNVTADAFTRNIEQEQIHVVGRGIQVQIGDDLGYNGTLTIKLRNAETSRRDRQFFEYLSKNNDGQVYLKSPFGDVILISIGSIATQRLAGVGGYSDMADLTVPYQQVFGLTEVTRPA